MAVLPAPLCYRYHQQLKNLFSSPYLATMRSKSFSTKPQRPQMVETQTPAVERHTITTPFSRPDHRDDASLLGWGAVADRASTGSLWSEEECHSHINHPELLDAALAVQRTRQCPMCTCRWTTRWRCATSTIWVSYTVTHGLPTVGVVPEKGVPLPAEYLPGSRNVTADQEFGHSIIC